MKTYRFTFLTVTSGLNYYCSFDCKTYLDAFKLYCLDNNVQSFSMDDIISVHVTTSNLQKLVPKSE